MDNNTMKEKFEKIVSQLKKLTENYKINKLNIEIVLHDEKENKDITLKLNEKHDILISNISKDSEDLTDTQTEDGTLRTLTTDKTDNTLSTSIFRTSVDDSEKIKSEDENSKMHLTTDTDTRISAKETELRGGFLKSKKHTTSTNNVLFSSTSELNTTIKNVFNKQSGGDVIMSATSEFKPTLKNTDKIEYSATSMSATSDIKVDGMKSDYSATSMSATSDIKGGGMKSDYSATSMSATSDIKGGGMKSDYSATSNVNASLKGGFNNMVFSETSHISKVSKKSFNKKSEVSLSKMDLIRQKIREIDDISNNNVFQKNIQLGAGSNKFTQIKQTIGINSSSTSSLCE